MTRLHRLVDSPLGPIHLSEDGSGQLTGVRIGCPPHVPIGASHPDDVGRRNAGHDRGRVLDETSAQLEEYFGGERTHFDIPLATGGSPFQREVWSHLRRVPFGTTVSYGRLATQLGRPGAARAVGHANARNPIAIVIPCHRVIGSTGGLTGYGGGIEAKRDLLDLEARVTTSQGIPPGTFGIHRVSPRPG